MLLMDDILDAVRLGGAKLFGTERSGLTGGAHEVYCFPAYSVSLGRKLFVEYRSQLVFLFLILAQGAHSIEECVTRLYEVFAPARFVSGLVSNDLALGFVVANTVLVTFGLWCWAVPVRSGWHAARGLVWFWTILELGNGIAHSALALSRGG
jgi:hypothetical protein